MKPIYARINNKVYVMKEGHNKFRFKCQNCGECCSGSKIVLSPYDILRLCFRLNIETKEFHKLFTRFVINSKTKIPMCLLKTEPSCPFFKQGTGCRVYDYRPYMCRAYPVGNLGKHYFIEDSYCRGCGNGEKQRIDEWLNSRQIRSYKIFDDLWQEFLARLKSKKIPNTREFQISFIKLLYDFDNKTVDTYLEKTQLDSAEPANKFLALLGTAEKLIMNGKPDKNHEENDRNKETAESDGGNRNIQR